jgi:subtilisin family serine protease
MPAAPANPGAVHLGLIDGGVGVEHPSLRQARVQPHGCGGQRMPDRHGTAVASLLVGRDGRFHGAAPGATLYAADIYCGSAAHGTVEAVIEALAWMAQERVPVINLSIVGPPNRLLERAVETLSARGHLLVAAVGNDGPAAPPLYPAGYAARFSGMVGVSAVDARRQVLLEAGQGSHVVLTAPGAELAAADGEGRGYAAVRGTSFAAPLVAGLLAARLAQPDAPAARQAIDALARQAIDLGAPGRDSVYGFGLVGEDLRIDPRRVDASR